MAIGDQGTVAGINQTLTTNALAMRNLMQQILDDQEGITDLGLAGLEALGFSSGDAANVITMFSYMNTIAGVYKGTLTQGTTFNFDNALSGLWAGE
jgi:hypothetical protein